MRGTALLVLALGLASASTALAQPASGSIVGQVSNATGAVVEVHAPDGRVVARVAIDEHGAFRVPELPPGQYDLTAIEGDRVGVGMVEVVAGEEASVVIRLDAAATSEVITIKSNVGTLAERSAEAVRVVTTDQARTQTADLGEVLARTEGVAVRRSAGLGSQARFSLDGLYDDQIRVFFDEVPLDIAGYPFGLVNVPVNLIERVELFRGVVPVRFGADALGGAVNLVASHPVGTHASASYQVGSFGTHRATASVQHEDDETSFDQSASLFFDHARNNYEVDVQAPDAQGRLHDVTVPRFHDAYTAAGGTLELGLRDHGWVDRLELRGFYTGYSKDLQSNAVMTVPYGEVRYGERVAGTSARYRIGLGDYRIDVLAAYAHERIEFHDASEWVYDWFGDQILPRGMPGEIDGSPHDDVYWQDAGFGRVLVARKIPDGELRLVASPQLAKRTGSNHLHAGLARDPLSAKHERIALVSGVEWELDTPDDRAQNIAFAKSYLFRASYEDVLPGDIFKSLSRSNASFGGGDGVRWRVLPWLDLKASYEYATRLPSTDELFGDGALVGDNLELEPETSHNLNVGPRVELTCPNLGELTVEVNAFWRDSHNLIVLLGSQQRLTYQNVYDARALGVDAAVAWSAPGRWVMLDASSSYLDLRNSSSEGTFGSFDGDRIPNRPYIFASFGARGRIETELPATTKAVIEPFYVGRYVHEFLRGWESLGLAEYQEVIPAQLAHDLGVTLSTTLGTTRWSATAEIDNVSDARLYDSFGAQRPGRAYYLKVTADL